MIQLSIGVTSFAAEDPGTWEPLFRAARVADRAGVDRLVVSDHVVFGERLEEYGRPEIGGQAGGKQPTGPDGHWLEPLTTLSVLAGMTSRIRLGTNILVAALRRPAVLAKSTATLDVLSGGRLDLGVGVGWQREEYEAAGLDFRTRGRQLDLTLEVCQTLWREPRADVELPGLAFEAIHMMPKPVRPGGVPLWISGRCDERVARRLARFGSGWIPWGEDAADLPTSIPRMREAVAVAGGDTDGIQVAGTLPAVRREDRSVDLDATMDRVLPLVEAGVTDLRAHLPVPSAYDEPADALRHTAAAFCSATRCRQPGVMDAVGLNRRRRWRRRCLARRRTSSLGRRCSPSSCRTRSPRARHRRGGAHGRWRLAPAARRRACPGPLRRGSRGRCSTSRGAAPSGGVCSNRRRSPHGTRWQSTLLCRRHRSRPVRA